MDLITEIKNEVRKFNELDDSTMEVIDHGICCELIIDGETITECYHLSVLERIRGINRGHGYNYF